MGLVSSSAQASLERELGSVLAVEYVIGDRDRLISYETDWTGGWQGSALLAVRPGSAEEVAAVLGICGAAGVGVVVQGGNTGLSGGSVPLTGEVVLLTDRLGEVGEVDSYSRQASFGAGVTLEAAQAQARSAGLDLAVDLAARRQATIGGMAATNAGGAMALRYGTMRSNIAGLEAVLADGTIVRRLSGLPKDNAGYDLPAILIGSEGTLGVITTVRLSLVKRCPERTVALVGVSGFAEAVELVVGLRDHVGASLEAAECFDRFGLELVCKHRNVGDPLERPAPVYVLIQVATEDPTGLLASAIEEWYLDEMVVGEGSERQAALWAYREGLNEAAGAEGVVRKYDVSVPIAAIPDFADRVSSLISTLDPPLTLMRYGHLGDGNIHLNLIGAQPERTSSIDRAIADLVCEYGGTTSAEHGVGLAKRAILEPTRSTAEVEAMRAIKRALDPAGILGADRVLPPDGGRFTTDQTDSRSSGSTVQLLGTRDGSSAGRRVH